MNVLQSSVEINLNEVCRTCTKTSSKMRLIFSFQISRKQNLRLSDLLWTCASIKAEENDGLPPQMCTKCVYSLSSFNKFREKCLKNEVKLLELIRKRRYKTKVTKMEEIKVVADLKHSESVRDDYLVKVEEDLVPRNTNNAIGDLTNNEIKAPSTSEEHELDLECKAEPTPNHIDRNPETNEPKDNHKSNLKLTKPQQCETCGKFLSAKTRLIEHLRTHTGERPYSCDICGKAFNKAAHLSRHNKIHTDERPFLCSICPRRFRQRNSLQIHILAHTGERSFTCSTCGKSFKQKQQLLDHIRAHSGIKPYKCDTCGKGFTRLRILRGHTLSHTGEKTHSCDKCDKRYTTLESLRRHMVLHEESNPKYKCSMCNLSFHYRYSLNKHMLVHSRIRKDKKYKCYLCLSSYTRQSRLITHMTKQHPDVRRVINPNCKFDNLLQEQIAL